MTTLSISSQGQITLPADILHKTQWRDQHELELFCMGDALVLRPAQMTKSDDIADLGGFFKNNKITLTDEALYQPVDLTE